MFFLVDTLSTDMFNIVVTEEGLTMFFDTKEEAIRFGQEQLQSFVVCEE